MNHTVDGYIFTSISNKYQGKKTAREDGKEMTRRPNPLGAGEVEGGAGLVLPLHVFHPLWQRKLAAAHYRSPPLANEPLIHPLPFEIARHLDSLAVDHGVEL